MDQFDNTDTDWGKWLQGLGTTVIGAYTSAQYVQPYEIQKMQIQALGDKGYYTEGKPGVSLPPSGISPLMVMAGAGLLLVAVLVTRKA